MRFWGLASMSVVRQWALAVAAPPQRQRACGLAAAPFLQALETHAATDSEFLGTDLFEAAGCMGLEVDVEETVASGPIEVVGAHGSERRAGFCFQLVSALRMQHGDWLEGPVSPPPRGRWQQLARLQFLSRKAAPAQARLAQALSMQHIPVQVGGAEWAVCVRATLLRLPPGYHQVVIQGLPAHYACKGVVEAVLGAAGYSGEEGVAVVHERAGRAVGPCGEPECLPALDTVVAVVAVGRAGLVGLPDLPAAIETPYWQAEVQVHAGVCQQGGLVLRRFAPSRPCPSPAAPAGGGAPDVVHPGVRPGMVGVYAGSGISRQHVGQAAPLAADVMVAVALPPGSREGLGFVRGEGEDVGGAAGSAAGSLGVGSAAVGAGLGVGVAAAAAGAAVAATRPSPPRPLGREELMPPAPPGLPSPPLDEPGFDAACQHVQEGTEGLSSTDVAAIVMQASAAMPGAYAAAVGATTPSQLPAAFRMALYLQASRVLGVEGAAALQVVPAEVEPGGGGAGLPSQDEVMRAAVTCGPPPAPGARRAGAGPTSVAGRVGSARGLGEGVVSTPAQLQPTRTRRESPGGTGSWLGLQAAVLGHTSGATPPRISPRRTGRGQSRGPGRP